mgnify:CR=1 FL=1
MFGRPQQQQQYPTRQNYQTADMPVGAGQHAAIASPRMHASPNTLQVNPNPMTSTSGLLLTFVCFLGYGLILNQPSTELFIVLITQPLSLTLTILRITCSRDYISQGFSFPGTIYPRDFKSQGFDVPGISFPGIWCPRDFMSQGFSVPGTLDFSLKTFL